MNKKKINDYLPVLSLGNGLLIAFLISQNYWLLYIALFLSFLSILFPSIAYYIGISTKEIVKFITMTVFVILATVLFYLFLTPIGFLKRISEKNTPFSSKKSASFFISTNTSFSKESFTKMG